MTFVVDVNVAIVANGRAGQASPECVLTCIQRLRQITDSERLALDGGYEIYKEYKRYLKPAGQPGVGDAFFKWVLTYQANPTRCDLVDLEPNDVRTFDEFPDDPSLTDFDSADRVYVAVSLAHPEHPPILQAVDSKWWDFHEPLRRNGASVDFLCEADIKTIRHRKSARTL